MLALLISSLLLVPRLLVLVAPGDAETKVSLPDGRVVWFAGEWTRRDTLWEDAAVVYRADGRALFALDGGSAEPRQVKAYPHKYWASTSGPTWSADGSTLYFWFDVDEQLVAMDRETGSRTSLTALGSHVINEKGNKHLDPHPVFRRDGLEEDVANGMLLFLLDEEENDEVPFWERRAGRGGTSLVGIDVADGAMTELIPKRVLPDVILSWDISLARGRLYLVSKPHVRYRPGEPHALEEWRLNGKKVRALPEVEGTAGDVHLSPDERLLLVERAYKPGKPIPDLALDDYTRADHDVLFEAKEGGFVLIDLETGDVADGPASGCETAWAPDGQRILYVDGWDVNVFDRQTGYAIQPRVSNAFFGQPNAYWQPRRLQLSAILQF